MNDLEGKCLHGYSVNQRCGVGTFSTVYQGIHLQTHELVALKVFSPTFNQPLIESEIFFLRTLDSPFIVEYFDYFEEDGFRVLVLEFLDKGDLRSLINQYGSLPESQAANIFCQLIHTFDYLHNECNIAHRDIKVENIMIDRNNNARLIDFGLSSYCTEPFSKACGSLPFSAPEMLKSKGYSASADLWSLGVVLYAMVIGDLPFKDDNEQRLIQKILFTEPKFPPTVSSDCKDLIRRLLCKEPEKRISIKDAIAHRWTPKLVYNFAELKRTPVDASCCSCDPSIVEELLNDNTASSEDLMLYRINRRGKVIDMISACASTEVKKSPLTKSSSLRSTIQVPPLESHSKLSRLPRHSASRRDSSFSPHAASSRALPSPRRRPRADSFAEILKGYSS